MPLPSGLMMFDFKTISEFVTSAGFVWVWCGFTIFYSVSWLVRLNWSAFKIKRHLRLGIKALNSFKSAQELAANFATLNSKLLRLGKLKQPWKEYSQSLIHLPEANAPTVDIPLQNLSPSQQDAQATSYSLRASRDPQDFFNTQSLIQPYIDLRFYAAIPSHLSGFGILGTFCGLASGIYLAKNGLTAGRIDELQHGLSQLLNGASLAFWTSIIGILTAIFFSRWERFAQQRLKSHIQRFNVTLGHKISPLSLEQISSSQLQHNLQHSHQNQYQLERVIASLQELHQDRSNANEQVLKQVAKEFHAVLTAAAGQEIKFIATAFKQIHYSLNETKDILSQSNKYMLDNMEEGSKAFKKNLYEISHQFQSSFHQTNDVIQATFKTAAKELMQVMSKSFLEMSETLKKPSKDLEATFKDLSQNVTKSMDKWIQANEKICHYSQKTLESHNKLAELIPPLGEAAHAIAQACTNAQSSLDRSATAAHCIGDAVKNIEKISGNLQQAWDSYCRRFEGVDQNLHHVFQQTNTSLHQYADKVKDFTLDLDRHLSKGVLTLAGAVGDLHQAVGSLPEMVKNLRKMPAAVSLEGEASSKSPYSAAPRV